LLQNPQRRSVLLDGVAVTVPTAGLAVPPGAHEIIFDLTT
jgi:hypothetical protein